MPSQTNFWQQAELSRWRPVDPAATATGAGAVPPGAAAVASTPGDPACDTPLDTAASSLATWRKPRIKSCTSAQTLGAVSITCCTKSCRISASPAMATTASTSGAVMSRVAIIAATAAISPRTTVAGWASFSIRSLFPLFPACGSGGMGSTGHLGRATRCRADRFRPPGRKSRWSQAEPTGPIRG